MNGLSPFVPGDINPLIEWAHSIGALKADLIAEDLVDQGILNKERRHKDKQSKIVAFLSHSSKDKPFIRQLAADLTAEGVDVWLDEQRIGIGDSIPEKIAQGLAESDFFLLATSQHSADSAWVKKELNNALVNEVQRRKVHALPLRLDDTPLPKAIADKKYADFSASYKAGLAELLQTMKDDVDD